MNIIVFDVDETLGAFFEFSLFCDNAVKNTKLTKFEFNNNNYFSDEVRQQAGNLEVESSKQSGDQALNQPDSARTSARKLLQCAERTLRYQKAAFATGWPLI